MPVECKICSKKAILKRPKTGDALCRECFYWAFEEEVHKTVIDAGLFTRGDRVAVGASGGKDSTVLAYVMKTLNERYDYGLDLVLLSVDEGITGYRDDSLETVKRNQVQYGLPLQIVSYEELYGWTMDAIVKEVGLKNNCTFCGVFRRQALDRGALLTRCNKIVTGHNADDVAETVIMNVLRGDIARLRRCTAITTGTEGALPRCKPFKYTYEKEIVMYAYFKKLDYFSTECIYSPNAYRGFARAYIKDAEKIRPSAIIDIIHSGESLCIKKDTKMPVQGTCTRCGYISSQAVCKACVMLEGLNKGLPRLGIGKTHKIRKQVDALMRRTEVDHQSAGNEDPQHTFCTGSQSAPYSGCQGPCIGGDQSPRSKESCVCGVSKGSKAQATEHAHTVDSETSDDVSPSVNKAQATEHARTVDAETSDDVSPGVSKAKATEHAPTVDSETSDDVSPRLSPADLSKHAARSRTRVTQSIDF